MYNRTATVADTGNRSPREMFYGEIPENSPIPFLKRGYCKYKRVNKMEPKARKCLGPARNHQRESKRVLVYTGNVIITRNVTGAHVRSRRSLITRSKPSVGGEGDGSGQGREASAVNSESASEDGESVSEGSRNEIETPEAEAAAPITPRRASTPRGRGSQCEVSIDPEGMTPGESLADTSAAASTSHRPDKKYTALGAYEVNRLAEYIPGPPRFSLRDRTRGEERRLTSDAQGLVSLEDELETA